MLLNFVNTLIFNVFESIWIGNDMSQKKRLTSSCVSRFF